MTAPALFPTPARLVTFAYEDARLVQEGDTPNSEQIARGIERLCDIINFFGTQGLKVWTLTDQSVTLVDGQQAYTIMPGGDVNITKPLRILQGYILMTSGVKRPIYPLSWDEWMRLSQTTQEGAISQFFVEKLYDRLKVYFWLIPDTTEATYTAHLLIQQQITNFTELDETLMFPQEWFLALRWALAAELAVGQPESIYQRCTSRAEAYRTMLENWDVEDPGTQFTPDPRIGQHFVGSFR